MYDIFQLTRYLRLNHGTTVQSIYNMRTGEVKNENELIPITLSALPHLEKLTVRGLVFFHLFGSEQWMSISIPAITNLLKTSSLKCVSLVLLCYTYSTIFLVGLATWTPLVRFFAESSNGLHIKTTEVLHGVEEIGLTAILTSLAACVELVDMGVLVITPQIPSVTKH